MVLINYNLSTFYIQICYLNEKQLIYPNIYAQHCKYAIIYKIHLLLILLRESNLYYT